MVIPKDVVSPEKPSQSPGEWTTLVNEETTATVPPPEQEATALKQKE